MGEKNKYGQYMTSEMVAEFMTSIIEHDNTCDCLEPSCGTGVFLSELNKYGYNNVLGIEIDKMLINPKQNVLNASFITAKLNKKFDVIIGNPPYIRWKNLEENLKKELEYSILWNTYCNSLCDYSSIFILKSTETLKEDGELIFITPDYWFSTTYAKNVRNYLLENGYIKEIYHFSETPIFDNVKVSFVIFKYIKKKGIKPEVTVTKYFSKKKPTSKDLSEIRNHTSKSAKVFKIPQFEFDKRWILVEQDELRQIEEYEKACKENKFQDFCEIGNGMVSGLDKAFQVSNDTKLNEEEMKNTIRVIKAKNLETLCFNKITRYIFLKKEINETVLKSKFPSFFMQFSKYKEQLLKRYNYGRNLKYWEWAFLRNFNLFKTPSERIFCPCKERITNKARFRFSVVSNDFYPTQDVTAIFKKEGTKEDIRYIAAILNSKFVFEWLCNKGTRKGDIIEFSEKPISAIPYRKIDFSNKKEKELHDKIVSLVEQYKKSKNSKILDEIDNSIKKLL